MANKTRPSNQAFNDGEIRALLDRHRCPVPFHAVRTRFLGATASPALSVRPIETVKALWGGELPPFESLEAVNELLGALIMGLWNRLGSHQERRFPFRLVRVDLTPTPERIARVALIRQAELDGFVEGLFGAAASLELPERARRALELLSETRHCLLPYMTSQLIQRKSAHRKRLRRRQPMFES